MIERRFRGPPDSANGGYTCGVLAAHVEPDPAVEVTLRAPPPLDRELQVETEAGSARLLDGGTLVAEARLAPDPDLTPPEPVTVEAAEAARTASPMQHRHPYPSCFVCGPERRPGDGLMLTCGPVEGRDLVASPWRTELWMTDGDRVRRELLWAVLDCPGGIAAMLRPGFGQSVLGRLTARVLAPAEPGHDYVAVGWPLAREGRKLEAGSAILDTDGEAVAVARATWIELRQQPEA